MPPRGSNPKVPMKHIVANLIVEALENRPDLAEAAADIAVDSTVERTRDASHGDFACNLAMRLAKPMKKSPRDIAASIIDALASNDQVEKVEIAGPGFINFHLSPSAHHAELCSILDRGADYGRQALKDGPKILLEFISANPTGPLHVGHGRHAAYGATVGNLLESAGYPVTREYYVNDAGRQMDILGASVWLRWLANNNVDVPFPSGGYRGDYIKDIAADIESEGLTVPTADDVLSNLPDDNEDNKDAFVDALIARAKDLQGEDGFERFRQKALDSILGDIQDDLEEFGVTFDNWYSEQSLTTNNAIDDAIDVLRERGKLYEKDGATWFPSTEYGDDKDRVVVRANGVKTYFASDIAYHFEKRERGFDHLIDILGQDHHGYRARLRAGLEAMGYKGEDLEVEFMQFVALYRGGEKVQMSTRSGEFDTLRQLRAEVGNDAARFYYVMRSNDQPLDFDLDAAIEQSSDNPVYYVQMAHARIAQVFVNAGERGMDWDEARGRECLGLLVEPQEKALMTTLSRFPEVIDTAARNRGPQMMVAYIRELVGEFHSNYNAHHVLIDDADLRNARLTLYAAIRQVIANGLAILGVSAPEKM